MRKLLNWQSRIESMVEAILDDVNKRHPHAMDELMHRHEYGHDQPITISISGKVPDPVNFITKATADFEVLRAGLGFIFGERYGWTEETIDGMTLPEVFIALEHAMEYDAPCKKSVWNL